VPESNPEQILFNLNLLLNFYIKNEFRCDIKINDEFWLTDLEMRDKIIDSFIEHFKSVENKPNNITIICNAIHCLNDGHEWFIKTKQKFQATNINLLFHIETMLIDIVDIQYLFQIKEFILSNITKLKVRINPNNFAYFI
jgi:hypothetical protein